jgi:hypothetical protein
VVVFVKLDAGVLKCGAAKIRAPGVALDLWRMAP